MNKKHFDYVISATSRIRLYDLRVFETHYKIVKDPAVRLMDITKEKIKKSCKNTDPYISVLYNGFVEAEYPKYYKALDNLGADFVYADSGGLQIITLGKQVTPEIKKKIYGDQCYADYAMCFDEIPLERTTQVRSASERVITHNKVFNQDRHRESGRLTGQNIKEQIDFFRKNNAKTKVIIIVQGNIASDMIMFYEEIAKQLDEDDYNYIGGLAVADTCCGNGTLESIEMMKAARAIGHIAHENVRNHLHFLGVGTLSRLRPIVYLLRSGYLDTYNHISYDSSTISSTYDFGKVIIDEKTKFLGQLRTKDAEDYFLKVYDYYNEVFEPLISKEDYIDLLFGHPDDKDETKLNCWKNSTTNLRVDRSSEEGKIITGLIVRPAYLYYQFANFIEGVDKLFDEKKGQINDRPISLLLDVKDDVSMEKWLKENKKYIKSSRIKRKEDVFSLEEFLI